MIPIVLAAWVLGAGVPTPESVELSKSTRLLPSVPGAWLEVEEQVWEARSAGKKHRYVVPRLLPAKGRKIPGLDEANRALLEACTGGDTFETFARTLKQDWEALQTCRYELFIQDRQFVGLQVCNEAVGAYPSINCSQHRFDAATGKAWSWLEDAVAPEHRAAFVKLCEELIQSEAVRHERGEDISLACDEAALSSTELTPQGDLRLTMGLELGHRGLPWRFEVTLPRAKVAPLLRRDGPLAKLATER